MRGLALAVVLAIATGIASALATGALVPYLGRRGLLDRPNERSSHTMPTPRGGGIAVVGVALLAWTALIVSGDAAPPVAAIVFGALFVAAVSWADDLRGLSPAIRLTAQTLAIGLGVLALPLPVPFFRFPLGLAAYPAILLIWLWAINLFNFMDGIDGLAGGEAAAIGLGLSLLALFGFGRDEQTALLGATLGGAAIGFLVWNWSPAKIFLGDVGSVPLGYLLGFLLLDLALRGFWKAALILPLYFVADATLTLVRRLLRGARIWEAHREHLYQHAVARGLGHAAVARRVIAADLVLVVCAWTAENGFGWPGLAIAAALVACLMGSLVLGG